MSTLIEFDGVCKYYQMGDTLVKAADHVSFKINKGEFVAIVGQSGSGKSTCMNIIGCLDVPEPDWPTMATNSPFSIFMVMWSAAFTVVSPIW